MSAVALLPQENCVYPGIRDDTGTRTSLYYEIFLGKLAFFIAFEVGLEPLLVRYKTFCITSTHAHPLPFVFGSTLWH